MEEKIEIIYNSQTENYELSYKDFIIKKSNDYNIPLKFINEYGSVVDITGATFYFIVKSLITDLDSSSILSKTVTSLTDPTSGETFISLTNSDTNKTVGNYIYGIKMKTSDNKIYTVMEGILTIAADVKITNS